MVDHLLVWQKKKCPPLKFEWYFPAKALFICEFITRDIQVDQSIGNKDIWDREEKRITVSLACYYGSSRTKSVKTLGAYSQKLAQAIAGVMMLTARKYVICTLWWLHQLVNYLLLQKARKIFFEFSLCDFKDHALKNLNDLHVGTLVIKYSIHCTVRTGILPVSK